MAKEILLEGKFAKKKWGQFLLIILAWAYYASVYFLNWMDATIALPVAIVVSAFAIILLIVCKPKDKLAITNKCIYIKQDNKPYCIPIDKITYLDLDKKRSIGIVTGQRVFRMKRLKNRKSVYAALSHLICAWQDKITQISDTLASAPIAKVVTPAVETPANVTLTVEAPVASTPEKVASAPDLPELPDEPPTTAEGKMELNKILFLRGEISKEERSARNLAILKEEFPDMY